MMTIKIKSRLWIEADDKILLGEGRISLLKAIEKEGSINLACKSLGMSYKKAWKMVSQMNETGSQLVVIKKTGGSGGGGSIVSEYGLQLINSFEEMRIKVWDILEEENKIFVATDE